MPEKCNNSNWNLHGWTQQRNGRERDSIHPLEDRTMETANLDRKRKQTGKKMNRVLGTQNSNIRSNICVSRVPEGEGKRAEKAPKEMPENFPHLARDINLHIWEAECTPNQVNHKKSITHHIQGTSQLHFWKWKTKTFWAHQEETLTLSTGDK